MKYYIWLADGYNAWAEVVYKEKSMVIEPSLVFHNATYFKSIADANHAMTKFWPEYNEKPKQFIILQEISSTTML